MSVDDIFDLTHKLIAIPSVSGKEKEATSFLFRVCQAYHWNAELIPVVDGRQNVLACFGRPEIIFTTHIDVVPAAPEQFKPYIEGDKIYGRGACDAKGIIACMLYAARALLEKNKRDFGLLFVVGEEVDGCGAKAATEFLKTRGVKYIVNGEPTEGKIIKAHKGAVAARMKFRGRSCHSGYPQLGQDANLSLINAAHKLSRTDFGFHPELGEATINLGVLRGGSASNVVSEEANLELLIRSVGKNESIIEKIKQACPEEASLEIYYAVPPAKMKTIPDMPTDVASFCTDIPNFADLNAECILYGPGSIHNAHTTKEYISKSDVAQALDGYLRIYEHLKSL